MTYPGLSDLQFFPVSLEAMSVGPWSPTLGSRSISATSCPELYHLSIPVSHPHEDEDNMALIE